MTVGNKGLDRFGIALIEECALILRIIVEGYENILGNGVDDLALIFAEVGELEFLAGLRIEAVTAYVEQVFGSERSSVNNSQGNNGTVGALGAHRASHGKCAESLGGTIADVLNITLVVSGVQIVGEPLVESGDIGVHRVRGIGTVGHRHLGHHV